MDAALGTGSAPGKINSTDKSRISCSLRFKAGREVVCLEMCTISDNREWEWRLLF